MHRNKTLPVLAVLLALGLAQDEARSSQTAEKTFVLEVPLGKGSSLRVENVLGSVQIRGSSRAGNARVEVQVIAEANSEEEATRLAGSVDVESAGADGERAVRVILPADVASVRLPKAGRNPLGRWVGSLFSRSPDVEVRNGGRAVRVVTDRKATALAVQLSVTVPHGAPVSVRQGVGSVRVEGARGVFRLESLDGRVEVSKVFGALAIDAAAADVGVTSFQGTELDVRTVSGNVEILEVRAHKARLRTESGAIRGTNLTAGEVFAESTTGDIKLEGMAPKTAEIRNGAGSVDLAVRIAGMRKTVVDSAEGDVVLRVSQELSFDLLARTESGEVKTLGLPLDVVEKNGNVSKLRQGRGGPEFDVTSASGTVTVRPYDASRFDILVGDVSH